MRKRIFLWLAIFCCLAFTVGILAACNGGDSTQTGGQTPADSSAYAGRYYEEVNGRLDADSWIELGDDWTWVDSDTMMGTFTVDGSSIHFYRVTASEPMFDGTISDGEFTVNILGTLCKYKQGTPSADTPEEPNEGDPDDEKPEEPNEGDPDDEKPEEPEGEYHTVTFDVNGGEEAVLPHEYLVGAMMSLPTPTREGYRFWGWFDELGVRYDNSSVMPNEDLTLTAEWKIIVTSYEDEYIYFKPATEGKKNSDSYYDRYASSGIHHYMYLELESDSIGGPEAVGSSNNLDLASRVDMDFSVADGYTLTWYNDSGFTSINGAQRFTLGYGSNIYFLTVSEGSRVVQRYLIDFYIKYDYYISLYSNIYENESYNEENRVRVIEGEKIAFSDLEQKAERDFEFDNWAYFNYDLGKYVEFDFDVAIYKNWSLYQTFKPQSITANLSGGSLDEELLITPYTPYQQLPVPTKENYDFIGWQLADGDYFADITGYGSTTLLSDDNYFKSLKAEFRPKKYYKDVSDEGDTISFVSTIPVVFYTDESRAEIHEIYYLPTELLPYSPVPDAVPLTGDDIFLGWRSYYGTEEAEIFDFNQAIEGPTSVFPEFRAATYDSEVGIGNGYTFTSDNSFDTHHVTVWLPSSGEYILTVSGKAGISVAAYGEYEASSYTSTSSRPATIVLLCDDLSGRSATVTLKQTSGKVTLSLSGETGYSDQSQKIDPTTAKYGEFGKEVLLNARENVGGIFLGWYDEDDVQVSGKGSYLYMFTMPGNEVTYTAKWAKVSVVSEDATKGTVSQLTKKYLPGEEVSVTATTNLGYTFIGWYNGDEKVADTLTYKFEMPAEDVTYTAKWIACPVNLEVSNADAGSVSMPTTTVAGERVAITATTNPGYTFIGWYNGNEQVAATPTYEFIMPTENVTYTAKWQLCATTLTVNDENAGSVSGLEGPTIVGNKVSVIATTNPGYTFIGWYNGEEKLTDSLTYEFTMSAENVTYTAKWIKVTVESEDTTKGTVSRLTGTYFPGEEVSITATTKSGYTFIGWYNGEEKVADSLAYEFTMPEEHVTYTAKWIKVTVESEDTAKGTVSQLTDTYVFGEEVSVTATTNLGYTFIGWYNGEEKVADSLAYEFTMPEESVTYTAKWIKVTVESEDTAKGTVSQLTDTYVFGEEVSVTATTNLGYTFIGWYNGEEKVADSLAYEFTMPEENVTYTAKWMMNAEMEPFVFTSTQTSLSITGVNTKDATSLTIPSYVTHIGSDAFSGCNALASIEVDVSNTTYASVDGILYNKAKTKFVHIPDAITGDVEIPGGVTSIANYAFSDCSNLASITIPDSVTSIGDGAFRGCTDLESVVIPNSVTSIGGSAFSGCSSLESMTIPFVGDEAGKTSSDTYQYPFGYIFGTSSYTGGTAVWQYYYGSSTSSTTSTTYYIPSSLCSVTVTGGNILYGAFNNCSMLTSITIPDSVTSIGERAFNGCAAEIVWGDAPEITEIGDNAFSGYKGTSITIPDSVTSIGRYAFYDCTSLESIIIPFVGATKDGTSNTHFGYIFGASTYSYNDDYVPTSLKKVIITGGTSIGDDAFYGCDSLTSVTIPNGVTSIGSYAFYDCSGLTSITIPDSVTSIGISAFSGCSGLTSITIPDSVTSIGSNAFSYCSGLISIYYTGNMESWLGKSWQYYVMSDGRALYLDGTKVEGEIDIPNGTTSIPSFAFAYQSGITSVTIPDSVTSIGSNAFSYCSGLISIYYTGNMESWLGKSWQYYVMSDGRALYLDGTKVEGEIDIPNGTTSIPSYAFAYQTGITSVTIPDSVTSIGEDAFLNCTGLTSVTIPDSVTSIGEDAFLNCTGLTSVTIPDSVTSIGERAFEDCAGLTSVTIPDSVTSIGERAFEDCAGLTSITIPDGVTSIGQGAFKGCSSLKSITIPFVGASKDGTEDTHFGYIFGASSDSYNDDYVPTSLKEVIITGGTSIGDDAFRNCTGLTSITIPDSVTSIGYRAFYNCSGLTSVTIPDSVTSIGSGAFSGCTGIVSAKIPTLAIAYIPKDSLQTVVLTSGESIEANAFSGCTFLTSITIPDSVTSIGDGAFSGCAVLPSVTIVNSVTSIGGSAFEGCTSLTSIIIPDSVMSIGRYAFSGCTSLESITIPFVGATKDGTSNTHFGYIFGASTYSYNDDYVPTSLKKVIITGGTSIGDDAFYGCDSLTSVTILDGVTSIGEMAFRYCGGLTSVTIGSGVTSIGDDAFYGCSSLESITIPFVGDEAGKTSSDTYQYPFGYIFGTSSYTGGEAVRQYYYGSSTSSTTSTTYYIPSSLRSVTVTGGNILYGAFDNCSMLTSVTIGNGVTSIGSGAFSGCDSLTSVTILDGVTSIGEYAFNGCAAEIVWGDDPQITEIGDYAFCGYEGTSITIPDSVTSIESYAFYDCTGLLSITIPDSVTSIGYGAFYGCDSLVTVYYTGDMTSWLGKSWQNRVMSGGRALYLDGTKVEGKIAIPDGTTSIPSYAFAYQTGITSVTIPDSVTSIGSGAFSGCDNLQYNEYDNAFYLGNAENPYLVLIKAKDTSITSVNIHDSTKLIYEYAFSGCSGLTSITILDSVTSIGSAAFSGCSSLEEITIPFVGAEAGKTSSDTYQYPFGYIFGTSSYTGGTAVEQRYYGSSSTSSNTYSTYYIPSSLRSVTVTGGNILYGAFYNCSMLTSVTIPDSVTSIGDYAFSYCSGLTSVTIGNGVTSIGERAFNGCAAEIVWGDAPEITEIGDYAFYGYNGTSITIPDSVTSIGDYAFSYCSGLTSITIPDSVTSIGYRAFNGCSGLSSVKFEVTEGWHAYGYSSTSVVELYNSDLSNTSTAAGYLKSQYASYYWEREVNE